MANNAQPGKLKIRLDPGAPREVVEFYMIDFKTPLGRGDRHHHHLSQPLAGGHLCDRYLQYFQQPEGPALEA